MIKTHTPFSSSAISTSLGSDLNQFYFSSFNLNIRVFICSKLHSNITGKRCYQNQLKFRFFRSWPYFCKLSTKKIWSVFLVGLKTRLCKVKIFRIDQHRRKLCGLKKKRSSSFSREMAENDDKLFRKGQRPNNMTKLCKQFAKIPPVK